MKVKPDVTQSNHRHFEGQWPKLCAIILILTTHT